MGFCFTQCRPEKGALRNPSGDISISKYLFNIFDSCTFLKVEQIHYHKHLGKVSLVIR